MTASRSTVRTSYLCIVALATTCCSSAAHAQQQQQQEQRKGPRPIVTLPSLSAQGFEIKASLGSSLQKGKDVWLCDMLTIKSSCDAAE